MKKFGWAIAAGLFFCTVAARAASPEIRIEDADLFFEVYDAAGGHPTEDQIQHDYMDKTSDGAQRFFRLRNTTAARIAQEIAQHPEIYADARKCLEPLPRVRVRASAAMAKLGALFPQAKFPPITIAVGRGKPVGISDETGVMIGLESLCAITYLGADVEDRFVHVIAHEYTHTQQAIFSPAFYNNEKPTVLEVSLGEGAAEFMAEQTSGAASSAWFADMTGAPAKATETAFEADEDKTDLSSWLYNGKINTHGDLGYWVGYRIVKSYYEHAADKRAAIREILELSDAHAFLTKSGWYPGIAL
jgi:uncharacterized protein YjaZ